MINHSANQSQTYELLINIFINIEKKKKSGVISGWTNIENPYRLPRE